MSTNPSLELAIAAADFASDRKATNIVVLNLSEVSSVANYFVIATGRSHIHVEAICARIHEGVRERADDVPIATEGLGNGQWAIMDYGDVVVHVFQESARGLYDLERLWREAPRWNYKEGSSESDRALPCFDGA
ncbi:MAG: ribosome-associated protein [Hyphomicrobiaceae bacterium]